MGSINLYKIDTEKQQLFFQALTNKMVRIETIEINRELRDGETESFGVTLYTSSPQQSKGLSWNWILEEFHEPTIEVDPSPKAVVVVEKEDDTTYALTFGQSFFLVDKFCDRDFGFVFARKVPFQEIKTTTLTTPSSRRNKIVNTYINYNELEFDSGESFAKLKAKATLPVGFTLYKPALEIGSSIRFATPEDSLDRVISIILHIENVLETIEDIYQIPIFSKITDNEFILQLNQRMEETIKQNPEIHISELDIVGATEVFNRNDSEFILKYRSRKKSVVSLSNDELEKFSRENDWDYSSVVLDISVASLYDGVPVVIERVRNMIDYTDDTERCLLSKGLWYKYNDDYLNYLRDSISEIPVEYHPEYDFSATIHDAFVDAKFSMEKDLPNYTGKTDAQIKVALKNKYYAERAFNLLREETDGFQNFDRDGNQIGSATVELMDLYKNGQMCAVKIGNTSAKLCYAVDQSLTSLRLYKHHMLPNMPEIDTVCIWIILERQGHIEDANGRPDINLLDMLMLKNKLDQWKKEVRLQGYRPMIYINYRMP